MLACRQFVEITHLQLIQSHQGDHFVDRFEVLLGRPPFAFVMPSDQDGVYKVHGKTVLGLHGDIGHALGQLFQRYIVEIPAVDIDIAGGGFYELVYAPYQG